MEASPPSVVVTGASTGIGAACALRLHRAGMRIFAGVRKREDGLALARQASDRLIPLLLDVTDRASAVAAAEAVGGHVGALGLHGLVNNAGIVGRPARARSHRGGQASVRGQRAGGARGQPGVLPLLRLARGRIVNIGSIRGLVAAPLMGPYAASKFALEALTDSLRLEVQPWGIEVSIVEPGAVKTPIWEKSRASAETVFGSVAAERIRLYERAIAAVQRMAARAEQRGVAADEVARVVERALTARRPKTRYLVGLDARLQALVARVLSDRARDRLMAAALGLSRRAT